MRPAKTVTASPFFLKFRSYLPTTKLCINGNEWANRQATKAGIGFTALDNGFATVDDPATVQAICDRLGPTKIDALLRKWLRRVPHPFTAEDIAAGYRYEICTAGTSVRGSRTAPNAYALIRTGSSSHSPLARWQRSATVRSRRTAV